MLFEDVAETKMTQSFALFTSVITSKWFGHAHVIVLLDKIDEFKAKLPQVPLEQYFPDYTGGSDVTEAVDYIRSKFMQEAKNAAVSRIHTL